MAGRFCTLLSIILAGLLLVGCAAGETGLTTGPLSASPQPTEALARSGDIAPAGPRPTEPPPPARETFAGAEVLSEGQNLQYDRPEPLFQVITTQKALDSFWQSYMPQGTPLPQVDFERSFVLVGIQGNMSTGGYGISFTGLEQHGDEVRVITQWAEPGCSDSVDMGFTQPYTVLRVDSTLLTDRGALVFAFETEAGRNLGRASATIP